MLSYLNNASQSQMQKLPSIGPKAAHCIISFRSLEGNFGDLESLKLVPGLRKNFYDTFLKVPPLAYLFLDISFKHSFILLFDS